MKKKLENRVAVITSAGKGIDFAIANRLVQEGARVSIGDIDYALAEDAAEKLKAKGKEILAQKVDVRDIKQVKAMFQNIRRRFGRVDILINNASRRIDKPLHKVCDEEWESLFATQLKGPFNCIREAEEDMVKQNYGKIVNISSPVLSGISVRKQTSNTCLSAAMEGFTRALAMELGAHNINVNCVAPDYIHTEMMRSLARDEGMYLDDYEKFAAALTALRRAGTTEEVANVVFFLVSDDSSFVSGQVIYVMTCPQR